MFSLFEPGYNESVNEAWFLVRTQKRLDQAFQKS